MSIDSFSIGGLEMIRYGHTNIIAQDCDKLITFYTSVFQCSSTGIKRDLRGEWLDKMTGIQDAHIVGEQLRFPGYMDGPTLEIFSYDHVLSRVETKHNRCGIAHIAFEVDDVEDVLCHVIKSGGSQLGEVIRKHCDDGSLATYVYMADPEGNVIEIQSWTKL